MTEKLMATYDYRKEGGELAYQVLRFAPKDFRMRCPDGSGGWNWKMNGVERIPYRLDEIAKDEKKRCVFVCEGERDCEQLKFIGLLATTNAGGAGKWEASMAEPLRGRSVYVIPDNDGPGNDHAVAVAKTLLGVAKSVHILRLPVSGKGEDVTDWLVNTLAQPDGTKESVRDILVKFARACPVWSSPAPDVEPDISQGIFSREDAEMIALAALVIADAVEVMAANSQRQAAGEAPVYPGFPYREGHTKRLKETLRARGLMKEEEGLA